MSDDLLALHQDASKKALEQLPEPKRFWHHLLMCLETPRPSDDCGLIRSKLEAFAKKEGLDFAKDSAGNVRIRRPAAPGYEKSTKLIIQGHFDVVCSKTHDKVHDFYKDPVLAIVEDGWLKADRTTLGADDGAGVAAILALLEDKDLKVGQLEGLFTAEEETTMAGAENLEPAPFLTGNVMINVDSEEPHSVCVGCAGGFEKLVRVPVKRVAATSQQIAYRIFLHGLMGGHTGTDINRNRANALQILGRVLDHVTRAQIPFHVKSIKGGNAPNAIPRDCTAVVYVTKEFGAAFEESLGEGYEMVRKEFEDLEKTKPDGPNDKKAWQFEVNTVESKVEDLITDEATTRNILDVILTAPHGVLRMVPGLQDQVDLSVAFSIATLDPVDLQRAHKVDEFIAHLFCRGTSMAQMEAADRNFDAYSRLIGAYTSGSATPFNKFPGWEPNLKSAALAEVLSAHRQLFGREPHVYSVHAGLECGLIQGRYPDMDCTSIGPLIEAAHSPDERLKIDTVEPFYNWLRTSVVNIAESTK
ncbi:aminoacyl-histidine dipeptidase [Planoprotostelium fungivorum]|uniref:Aminoacyl-histidine dipeptidase n=1 Tax=Planoprotostelium fungivorum TaxID=1890364 RepID=A0A2P6NJ23_9EUKA|nr:aminoacyl-histidine dipeptidase [Planoprotostelium fungivorum]